MKTKIRNEGERRKNLEGALSCFSEEEINGSHAHWQNLASYLGEVGNVELLSSCVAPLIYQAIQEVKEFGLINQRNWANSLGGIYRRDPELIVPYMDMFRDIQKIAGMEASYGGLWWASHHYEDAGLPRLADWCKRNGRSVVINEDETTRAVKRANSRFAEKYQDRPIWNFDEKEHARKTRAVILKELEEGK